MAEYPRPASRWEWCYSHGDQIPEGEATHWRDERTFCERCTALYDKRKPVEAGVITSRAKRSKKPKKAAA